MPRLHITQTSVPEAVNERRPFVASNMRGESFYAKPGGADTYDLSSGDNWNTAVDPQTGSLYVVWSFATPVAWIDEYGQAVVSEQYYSVRTSRHMSLLRSMKDDDMLRGSAGARKAARDRVARAFAQYHKNEAARKAAAERVRRDDYNRRRREERAAARVAREVFAQEVQGAINSILATNTSPVTHHP